MKILKITAVVLLSFILSYFLLRNILLKPILEKRIAQYSEQFNCEIKVENAKLQKLSTFCASKIFVKPIGIDTLLIIKNLKTEISFLKLLTGSLHFKTFSCDELYINIYKQADSANYTSFFQKKTAATTLLQDSIIKVTKRKPLNYTKFIESIFSKTFNSLPNQIQAKQILIKTKIDNNSSLIISPYFYLDKNNFYTTIYAFENREQSAWKCLGNIDDVNNKIFVTLTSLNNKKYKKKIPVLGASLGLELGADTLSFSINEAYLNNNEFLLKGYATAKKLLINHKRISPDDVIIKKGVFNFSLNVTPTSVQLDSTSFVALNKVFLNTYFNIENKKSKNIKLKIALKEIPAQDFFESLPQGLFQNFEGIKTQGKLHYNLNFSIDLNNPDSVFLESNLEKKDFKITNYGKVNFNKISNDFLYTVYEEGKPIKTFLVGPSNPNYTPISEISLYLKHALITSEDGNFYYHEGFNQNTFKQSISTNIKEKRFVRGGSTISMQLVKNVFLTRNKTVARKIEEMLIVWLIESNHLVSKERMYEVYLNIIEWGPGVYGIGEASHFYFNKKPSDLTLEESIFLASIVPRPKAFKYSFDQEGNLKQHLENYYKVLANHLWVKGIITEEQKENIKANVHLNGVAKNIVIKPDTSVNKNILQKNINDY